MSLDVVTGAFGYTGGYIARRLLAMGKGVRTLTGHPDRPDPLRSVIEVAPLDFENPQGLRDALRGAAVLYNTYWVRFPRGAVTFERAVANSVALFRAAQEMGVGRVVHISHIHADPASPLPYFRGKGEVEEALRTSGLPYGIVRPGLEFGDKDILVNNIAWFLRRSPIFPIPGSGSYRVQPVFVDDVARVAVEVGGEEEPVIVDAVGPEVYSYQELVAVIRDVVGSSARLVRMPSGWVRLGARVASLLVRDVVLTPDEIRGLMAGLLAAPGPATASGSFREWLAANGAQLGTVYASELERHYT